MKPLILFILLLLFLTDGQSQRLNKTKHIDTALADSSERQREYEALVKGTSLDTETIPDSAIAYYVGYLFRKSVVYWKPSPLAFAYTIDKNQSFIFHDTVGSFVKIFCGSRAGYILKNDILKQEAYTSDSVQIPSFRLRSSDKNTFADLNNSNLDYQVSGASSEGSSYSSSGSKTVHVSGYNRQDGTHVNSYYRSAPSKH